MALFRNTSKKAKKDLEKTRSEIKPYYDPYINAGSRSLDESERQYQQLVGNYDTLEGSLMELINDPGATIQRLGQGYEASPRYQNEYNASMNAITNAQAAGGMAGSEQHKQEAGAKAANLSGQDVDKYLQMALGLFSKGLGGATSLYNTGLKGLGHLADTGYKASSDLATSLGNIGMSEANLDYASDVNHNNLIGNAIEGAAYGVGNLLHPRAAAKAKSGGGSSGGMKGIIGRRGRNSFGRGRGF